MSFQSKGFATVGTFLKLSSTPPPTADVAGYQDASVVYVETDEGVEIGAIGPSNNVASWENKKSGTVEKRVTVTNYGTQTCSLAYDSNNDAQELLALHADNKEPVTVGLVLRNGDQLYYTAYVSEFTTDPSGEITMANGTLEVTSKPLLVKAA